MREEWGKAYPYVPDAKREKVRRRLERALKTLERLRRVMKKLKKKEE